MSLLITPAPFSKRIVWLADGCFRDEGNLLLAADGSRYFLEWTPTINPEKRKPRDELIAMAPKCTLAGGGWSVPKAGELITLANHAEEGPATFEELKKDTFSDLYITCDDDPSSSGLAFCVFFGDGLVSWDGRSSSGRARFVRRVSASQLIGLLAA